MTSTSLVAQARKMNHAAIKARKAGNVQTAAMCVDFRKINMFNAGIQWLNNN